MDSFKFRRYSDNQRVLSPETLARWAAMQAAEEWLSYVQYQLAASATKDALALTGNDTAASAAGRLYIKMVEVPTSGMPSSEPEGEAAWNAARSLFALAGSISEEEADAQLREDFRYYAQLLQEYFDTLYKSCAQDHQDSNQHRWLGALLRFVTIECGVDATRMISLLERRHDLHCPHCAR